MWIDEVAAALGKAIAKMRSSQEAWCDECLCLAQKIAMPQKTPIDRLTRLEHAELLILDEVTN